MPANSLDFIFNPKSIAVVGASTNTESHGHNFLKFQMSYGFKGKLYPINPKSPEILGLKAYPSLLDVPDTIDHVICAININMIPDIVTQAAQKGVKSVHIYSGRASETGRPEAIKNDEEILRRARQAGIRIVGPNALGIFCPRTGIAFGYEFPEVPGSVGAIMQSGANSTDLCHFSALRGVRFSKVCSYGNALDINEMELLEYFTDDEETKILLCYLEGLKDEPQKFVDLVRKAAKKKPVIICKGARTKAGARFSLGHNTSKAEIGREIWEGPVREAGAILVRNVDELINMAVAFSFLPPVKGNRLGAAGGGGGTCVLYTDEWEENGFELPPIPQEMRDEFKNRGSQLWDWMNNPGDSSIEGGDAYSSAALLMEMTKHPDFDFIVGYVSEDTPFNIEFISNVVFGDIEQFINIHKVCKKPFFVIIRDRPLGTKQMDGPRHRIFAEARTRLLEAGVPFFTSAADAARTMKEYIDYHQRKS